MFENFDFDGILKMVLAGVSGGILRVKVMIHEGQRLKPGKIAFELMAAAICSIYLGDVAAQFLPESYEKLDNFVYFICGYGGMALVDLVYKKVTRKWNS